MSCCDETTARVPPTDLSRRSLLKGAAVIASVLPGARQQAQGRSIKLAYCSQLLCGVPYEVARSAGHFKKHGLNVELVYTRGGSAAMQALVGNAVDYAATSLDVAITAFAKGAGDQALRRHRPAAAVRAGDRAEDRRPDQGRRRPAGPHRRGVRARQCRPCADALSAGAGQGRRRQGQVRDHGRQPARSAASGPDRRRPGAGAGAHAAAARRRARAGQRHGPHRRPPLSRRHLRVHGRRGAHQGDGAAQGRDADARPGRSPMRSRRCAA